MTSWTAQYVNCLLINLNKAYAELERVANETNFPIFWSGTINNTKVQAPEPQKPEPYFVPNMPMNNWQSSECYEGEDSWQPSDC